VQRDYLIPHIIVYLGRGKEVDNACLTHARGDGTGAVWALRLKEILRQARLSLASGSWEVDTGNRSTIWQRISS
jgi:hypothetical protein